MKKTFPVNINGSVFYIDDDAYQLLSNYLDQLRNSFPGSDGIEIISDIESRIAELFGETISMGANVITLDEVNKVMEQLGRPSELQDDVMPEHESDDSTVTPPPFPDEQPAQPAKRLYRSGANKVFGGVFGGLAIYLGWNVQVMRLLYAVLTCCTYVWPFTVIYLLAWMIIPEARTPRQKLEMTGRPVTLNNVGQAILGTAEPDVDAPNSLGNFLNTCGNVLGKLMMGMFGIIAVGFAIALCGVLITAISGLLAYWGWHDTSILAHLRGNGSPIVVGVGSMLIAVTMLIPCLCIIWGACVTLFKFKGASTATIISIAIVEVLLIIATIVAISVATMPNSYYLPLAFAGGMVAIAPTIQIC